MRPLLPVLLVALLAGGAGTFAGGATAAGATAAAVAVLALATLADGRDPWRLGGGRFLVAALVVAAAGSLVASPVPRAGLAAVLLLPAFLLLPSTVALAWHDATAARRGRRALAVVLLGICVVAITAWLAGRGPRPALPLGHHNLLATWLATLLPLAVPEQDERRGVRWLGIAAVATAVLTLVLTRSFAGTLGLAAGLLVLARGRWRGAAAAIGIVAVAVALVGDGRAADLASGGDRSLRARGTYLAAAWHGLLERPILGWGPGATPWTIASQLTPDPAVQPPGEVVGDLHSLPAAIGYELGTTGLLVTVGLAIAFLRRHGRIAAADPLGRRGLAGLAGFVVAGLGGAPLAVTGLPAAAALAAGAVVAAWPEPRHRSARGPTLYAVGAALALVPLLVAQWRYELASHEPDPALATRHLDAARALDPLPLYAVRRAGFDAPPDAVAAQLAGDAARDADGVAALWLVAGERARAAGLPWAENAFARACRLDPLAPLPVFELAMVRPDAEAAPLRLALALAAEPRLAAATDLARLPRLAAAALVTLERLVSLEAGWRLDALAAARRAFAASADGSRVPLSLGMDSAGATALSLHAFRRSPWPAELARIELLENRLAALGPLPPAPPSEQVVLLRRAAACR